MKQIVVIPAVLVSFILFCIKPVEGAEQKNLVEELSQPDLSIERQQKIIESKVRNLKNGIEFFLTENIDELVPKADQKMVFERMITVGIENYSSRIEGFSVDQRQQAADKFIPFVENASQVAHIFLWDNKKDTGSLIVDSPMTKSQMRELVKRGQIRIIQDGIKLLASRPANFPADQLPNIVGDMTPHINDYSDGAAIFIKRGASSFEEGTGGYREKPVDRKVIEDYTLSESLLADLVNATKPHIKAAQNNAQIWGSFISMIGGKHPEYPLTYLLDETMLDINTVTDALSFLQYQTIRVFSVEERGRLIRHIIPLITDMEEAEKILDSTRYLVDARIDLLFRKYRLYYKYLAEEDTKYLLDNIAHFFDSPEKQERLNWRLERQEIKYVRKVIKDIAKGKRPKTTFEARAGLSGCGSEFEKK